MIKQKYSFKLPMPPSINHAYGRHGIRTYATAEMKDFKDATRKIIESLGLPKVSGAIKITLHLFFNHYTKAGILKKSKVDVDNRDKVLSDALKLEVNEIGRELAHIMKDDELIFHGEHVKYLLADIEPHVKVVIEEIDLPIIPDDAYDVPDYLKKALEYIDSRRLIRIENRKKNKLKKQERLQNG
jgi:Holliday junction resolvase RusA-like endonuclease